LDYFNFTKEYNVPEIAKKILKGEYDYKEEEQRMNQLMITTMSKSQIKNIKINRKLDKKVNNAKFVSAQ